MRYSVGDRVKATRQNIYTTFGDTTIEVGTPGTVTKVDKGNYMYTVQFEAEWKSGAEWNDDWAGTVVHPLHVLPDEIEAANE